MTRNLPAVQVDKSLVAVSPLQLYLREISKYPLLSPEEEQALAKEHFEQGDVAAAHRLVTSNLRLVVKIANDFKQAQANLLDLIQEGNYGLMQAVKRFNPYKGVKLSSYAAWWIKAYILKSIMDNKSQVKMGTTVAQRKLFYNLKKETDRLLSEYDSVDPKMLAEHLDVKEKDVIEMQMRLTGPDVSLDAPVSGEEGMTRGALIPAPQMSVEDRAVAQELKELFGQHLDEFVKTLKDRDREVFELRMLSEEPITLQDIGDRFGITRERARQLEAKILKNLRKFVKEKGVIDL